MFGRWIERLLLVRLIWSRLGSGRRCVCGCLVLLALVIVGLLVFFGWLVSVLFR